MTFNSKSIVYSSRACVLNMHENMAFVIGKLDFVPYKFGLGYFPHTYTTYVKGIVGLGGLGSRVAKAKDAISQLTNINRFAKRTVSITIYTTITNFSTKYLLMCKVYTDVGGIK